MRNVTLLSFLISILFITVVSFCVFCTVYSAQPQPYMDEIFHIPQAQRYCERNFTYWDPKITTPPGLYIISNFLIHVMYWTTGISSCSVFILRLSNCAFTVGNFCLLSVISIKLSGSTQDTQRSKLVVSSLVTALLPVSYFFTFLYYTDPGTVFFILLMYLYSIFDRHWGAALAGLIAVFFRQTSIIWVFFVAAIKSMTILSEMVEEQMPKVKDTCTISKAIVLAARGPLPKLIFGIAYHCMGYILVGVLFLLYLVINGGIVLGDRTAHEVCFHVPQLGYFLLFTLIHAFPIIIKPVTVKRFFNFCLEKPFLFGTLLMTSAVCADYFTYVHPYLLADNRHFTFYIWRRVLGRSQAVSMCLVVVYVYAAFAVLLELSHKSLVWRIMFSFCVCATVIPQKLIEFRYFIVPYLLFRINTHSVNVFQITLEGIFNVVVNCVVLYLFLHKTFKWDHEDAVQRFMW